MQGTWTRTFTEEAPEYLSKFSENVDASIGEFLETMQSTLSQERAEEMLAALEACKNAIRDTQEARLEEADADGHALLTDTQRDISRDIKDNVTDIMRAGYDAAALECGTGMFDRMTTLLNTHVANSKTQMFSDVSAKAIKDSHKLISDIHEKYKKANEFILKKIETEISSLWMTSRLDAEDQLHAVEKLRGISESMDCSSVPGAAMVAFPELDMSKLEVLAEKAAALKKKQKNAAAAAAAAATNGAEDDVVVEKDLNVQEAWKEGIRLAEQNGEMIVLDGSQPGPSSSAAVKKASPRLPDNTDEPRAKVAKLER